MRLQARLAVHLGKRDHDNGCLNRDGERRVYESIAGAPAGTTLRLDVGPVHWPTSRVMAIIEETLGRDAVVLVEGPAQSVAGWLRESRTVDKLPQGWAA